MAKMGWFVSAEDHMKMRDDYTKENNELRREIRCLKADKENLLKRAEGAEARNREVLRQANFLSHKAEEAHNALMEERRKNEIEYRPVDVISYAISKKDWDLLQAVKNLKEKM